MLTGYILFCKECDKEFVKHISPTELHTLNVTSKVCKRCWEAYFIIPKDRLLVDPEQHCEEKQ